MASICISSITNDIEHQFIHLSFGSVSSLVSCLFLMPAFSIALAVFCLLNFGVFFPYVLVTNPYKRINMCILSVEKLSVLESKGLAQDHVAIHGGPVWLGIYWGFPGYTVFLLLSLWTWNVRSGSGKRLAKEVEIIRSPCPHTPHSFLLSQDPHHRLPLSPLVAADMGGGEVCPSQ